MKEERGKWENEMQSKLYDFEADVSPDDWEAIAGRLPASKSVAFRPYRKYIYAAAAVIALLLIGRGIYVNLPSGKEAQEPTALVDGHVENKGDIVDKVVETAVDKSPETVDNAVDKPLKTSAEGVVKHFENSSLAVKVEAAGQMMAQALPTVVVTEHVAPKRVKVDVSKLKIKPVEIQSNLMADASPKRQKPKSRRFGFGMGGASIGGFSTSDNTNALHTYSAPLSGSSDYREEEPEGVSLRNGSGGMPQIRQREIKSYNQNMPTTSAKHKRPISAGLGVSYYLNARWSLHSGLVYTQLRSEWNYDEAIGDVLTYMSVNQKLHYLGVPLSVSYKMAEWQHFQFYVLAGGMGEKNISGRIKTESNMGWQNTDKLKMKELMWSLNARAGVSYPIWKFISLYAEGGASYYFDNKSFIKTIRSDKPFNVSLQAGLRLGF